MRNVASVLRVLVLAGLWGCGHEEGQLGPPTFNATGNWQFSATSTAANTPSLMIAGGITQSGTSLTGAVHFSGSPCFDPEIAVALTGTRTDRDLTLTSASADGQLVSITGSGTDAGSLTEGAFTGTYSIVGGCADGDHGNIVGTRFRSLSGRWRVIFDVNDQTSPGIATISQGGVSAQGSSEIGGPVTSNIFPCLGGTLVPGTFPVHSFILGTLVALEIETLDGTVLFEGTLRPDGTIFGTADIVGGPCGENIAFVSLSRLQEF